MNKCHIRAIEDRPGDKAGHKWQVNYNLTENYGWTGRKTFVTLEETRAYAKAKGWTVDAPNITTWLFCSECLDVINGENAILCDEDTTIAWTCPVCGQELDVMTEDERD